MVANEWSSITADVRFRSITVYPEVLLLASLRHRYDRHRHAADSTVSFLTA